MVITIDACFVLAIAIEDRGQIGNPLLGPVEPCPELEFDHVPVGAVTARRSRSLGLPPAADPLHGSVPIALPGRLEGEVAVEE